MRIFLLLLFIAAVVLLWQATPLRDYATPDNIVPLMDDIRDHDGAVFIAFAIYSCSMLVFFPHLVMSVAVALVFPPLQSIMIILGGSLLSGVIGFAAGRKLGFRALRFLTGKLAAKIEYYAENGSIVGFTLLRMVPVAPFMVINLVLGMSHAPLLTFIISTLLGLLPGTLAMSLLGSSLIDMWESPDSQNMSYVASGVAIWITVVAGAHFISRSWQKAHPVQHNHEAEARV